MKASLAFLLIPALSALAGGPDSGLLDTFGPLYKAVPTQPLPPRHGPRNGIDAVRSWNEIAIDASGFDHANAREQLGPCRASRALAIVHIAMFDSVVALVGKYQSYTGVRAPAGLTSPGVAVSQAAHDALVTLFPAQKEKFDTLLNEDLGRCTSPVQRANGIDLGRRAAKAILDLRHNDGSQRAEIKVGTGDGEYHTSDLPGHWRQDPFSTIPLALGAKWGACLPFVMAAADQFRVPPPPALDGPAYAAAYNEAKLLGGENSPARTPEQTRIGIYWAYDGTPALCAPPRLYNQIALQIADQMRSNDVEVARLLALVNVAMADAGIAVWESKYHYDFWRPVTGIHDGADDGNEATPGDPDFKPLGAPASNISGPNFTPPFPAYPSGHAGFGGALFQTLRRFYGTDRIRFTFVSDEFNGITTDNAGNVRPFMPRSFSSLSQAEEENGQSRIYLGIHWSFDKTEGIKQGNRVGDYVFDHVFRPERR